MCRHSLRQAQRRRSCIFTSPTEQFAIKIEMDVERRQCRGNCPLHCASRLKGATKRVYAKPVTKGISGTEIGRNEQELEHDFNCGEQAEESYVDHNQHDAPEINTSVHQTPVQTIETDDMLSLPRGSEVTGTHAKRPAPVVKTRTGRISITTNRFDASETGTSPHVIKRRRVNVGIINRLPNVIKRRRVNVGIMDRLGKMEKEIASLKKENASLKRVITKLMSATPETITQLQITQAAELKI